MSVVLPTYNRCELLPSAVASVLAQDFAGLELLLVDDGSTDATPQWAATQTDPRLRYIRQGNQGAAAARNHGIREARGDLVAFMDSDDAWLPGALANLVAALDAAPEAAMAYGDFVRVSGPDGTVEQHAVAPALVQGRLIDPATADYQVIGITMQAVVVRKSALESIGGFDERFRRLIDMEMFMRLALRYPCVHVRREVLRYNATAGISSNPRPLALARRMLLERNEATLRADPAAYARQCWRVGTAYGTAGELREARAWFRKAVRARPASPRYAGSLLVASLGRRAYDAVAGRAYRSRLRRGEGLAPEPQASAGGAGRPAKR